MNSLGIAFSYDLALSHIEMSANETTTPYIKQASPKSSIHKLAADGWNYKSIQISRYTIRYYLIVWKNLSVLANYLVWNHSEL